MKTAMILAAGRGERLKPLTNNRPKALCLVNQIPLIEHHVLNLWKSGFKRLIINHAYLGGQIRQHFLDNVPEAMELHYSPEPPGGLETGGGIVNALQWLGNEPFLTVNADIYTDFSFSSLTLPSGSLAHLVLGNNPAHNQKGDFGLENQVLCNTPRNYTWLGIACYHPDLFKRCAPGRFSVVPLIRDVIEQQRASGELFQGKWVDIGTIDRLNEVNQDATSTPAART